MFYNTDLSYFFAFSIFDLILLTYQDFKEMKVDARYNFFMSGIMVSMIAIKKPPIMAIGVILGVTILFSLMIRKYVGRGDITAFSWIIPGLWLYNFPLLFIFFLFIVILSITHFATLYFMRVKKGPYYPVILASFLATVFINFFMV